MAFVRATVYNFTRNLAYFRRTQKQHTPPVWVYCNRNKRPASFTLFHRSVLRVVSGLCLVAIWFYSYISVALAGVRSGCERGFLAATI